MRTIAALLCLAALAGCARNLADRLVSGDDAVRQAALEKMTAAGLSLRKELAGLLAGRIADKNGNVRRRAVDALGRLGPDAVGPLMDALQHPDRRARAAAAEALGRLDADAKPAAGALVAAERDPDAEVRMWAAVSLSRVKAAMTPAELRLFRAVHGAKEVVVQREVPAARTLAPNDPRRLLQELKRADRKSRTAAVLGLVQHGPLAVPALLGGLQDPDEAVRDGAAEALRVLSQDQDEVDSSLALLCRNDVRMDKPAAAYAAPELAALLRHQSLCVRLTAARLLGDQGPRGRGEAGALIRAADEGEPILRQAALRALRKVSGAAAPADVPADRLAALWREAMGHFSRGAADEAMALFSAGRREAQRTAFLSLGPSLPAVARGLDVPLTLAGAFEGRVAVMEGRAFIEGVEQALHVQFVKDDGGDWKIGGF